VLIGYQLQEQQLNPLSEVVEENRRSTGKKSAADVIANANKLNKAARREAIERSASVESDGALAPPQRDSGMAESVEVKMEINENHEDDVIDETEAKAEYIKPETEVVGEPEPEIDSEGDIEMIEISSSHPSKAEPEPSLPAPQHLSPPTAVIPTSNRRATRKRKAPTTSPDPVEKESKTRTRGRSKKAVPVVASTATRSLRSRAPKSEVEEKEEMERRERVRMALESEEEWLSDGDIS